MVRPTVIGDELDLLLLILGLEKWRAWSGRIRLFAAITAVLIGSGVLLAVESRQA